MITKKYYPFFCLQIISILSLYACNETRNTENKIEQVVVNDTISTEIESVDVSYDNPDYIAFKSYFPDITLGEYPKTSKKLPKNAILKEYYDYQLTPEDIDAGAKLELRAVGKIIGYKGFDLFVIEDVNIRPDEDSYENHVENYLFLMIFKNGKPVIKDNRESELRYTFRSQYWGEGGGSEYDSFFDKDSTIITTDSNWASESATGYSTSINSNKKYRRRITNEGNLKLVEITQMEYSSDFYSQSYIDENQIGPNQSNENFNRTYPTEKNKENIDNNPLSSFDLEVPVNCFFYYKEIDDELRIIFENMSIDGDIMIDRYILGLSQTSDNKNTVVNKYIKCPIIIKTSDGDLEILLNGKFHLRK